MSNEDCPIFCDRCMVSLKPGTGDFYVVRIEAVADPSPPVLDEVDLPPSEIRRQMDSLVRDMESLSPQEAMDQVRRHVTIQLCRSCYVVWIEDPAAD